LFAIFQSKTNKGKGIAFGVIVVSAALLAWKYGNLEGDVEIAAPIFQHFNPCFVVGLTPVSVGIFSWLASKGKEPSAPRKIALGMLVAAVAYFVMVVGSLHLPSPDEQKVLKEAGQAIYTSPNWLIMTYLILTFGELLLSPMGISFVSKVAPPKYKGLMMGGWFVATAIGNGLVSVGGYLWGGMPLWQVWCVFIALCLVSALFMFAIMKRLEKVA
jgi:POT family proton-dependent oligopeptide transporter